MSGTAIYDLVREMKMQNQILECQNDLLDKNNRLMEELINLLKIRGVNYEE